MQQRMLLSQERDDAQPLRGSFERNGMNGESEVDPRDSKSQETTTRVLILSYLISAAFSATLTCTVRCSSEY
jgi:hypothetical protein